MDELAEYFNDPLNPERSLQLNNNYWPGETFRNLHLLRDAEESLQRWNLFSVRKTLRHVQALLPQRMWRPFLRRLVYSLMYSVSFAPIRFSLKVSQELVDANTYRGSANEAQMPARHTEELKSIVDLVHSIYRRHYGIDLLSSTLAIRYMNSHNTEAIRTITQFGEFSNFHLDEGKDFTCILYLSDVKRENGCFSYLDGSPAVRKSHILRALHQVVDFDLGLSSPEQVAQLPLELRGGMGIGDYLDDAKKDRVRRARVDVVGNPGDGIIFNGYDTIHRGGKPLEGERTALFISTRGHVNMRVKKAAVEQLAYLCL